MKPFKKLFSLFRSLYLKLIVLLFLLFGCVVELSQLTEEEVAILINLQVEGDYRRNIITFNTHQELTLYLVRSTSLEVLQRQSVVSQLAGFIEQDSGEHILISQGKNDYNLASKSFTSNGTISSGATPIIIAINPKSPFIDQCEHYANIYTHNATETYDRLENKPDSQLAACLDEENFRKTGTTPDGRNIVISNIDGLIKEKDPLNNQQFLSGFLNNDQAYYYAIFAYTNKNPLTRKKDRSDFGTYSYIQLGVPGPRNIPLKKDLRINLSRSGTQGASITTYGSDLNLINLDKQGNIIDYPVFDDNDGLQEVQIFYSNYSLSATENKKAYIKYYKNKGFTYTDQLNITSCDYINKQDCDITIAGTSVSTGSTITLLATFQVSKSFDKLEILDRPRDKFNINLYASGILDNDKITRGATIATDSTPNLKYPIFISARIVNNFGPRTLKEIKIDRFNYTIDGTNKQLIINNLEIPKAYYQQYLVENNDLSYDVYITENTTNANNDVEKLLENSRSTSGIIKKTDVVIKNEGLGELPYTNSNFEILITENNAGDLLRNGIGYLIKIVLHPVGTNDHRISMIKNATPTTYPLDTFLVSGFTNWEESRIIQAPNQTNPKARLVWSKSVDEQLLNDLSLKPYTIFATDSNQATNVHDLLLLANNTLTLDEEALSFSGIQNYATKTYVLKSKTLKATSQSNEAILERFDFNTSTFKSIKANNRGLISVFSLRHDSLSNVLPIDIDKLNFYTQNASVPKSFIDFPESYFLLISEDPAPNNIDMIIDNKTVFELEQDGTIKNNNVDLTNSGIEITSYDSNTINLTLDATIYNDNNNTVEIVLENNKYYYLKLYTKKNFENEFDGNNNINNPGVDLYSVSLLKKIYLYPIPRVLFFWDNPNAYPPSGLSSRSNIRSFISRRETANENYYFGYKPLIALPDGVRDLDNSNQNNFENGSNNSYGLITYYGTKDAKWFNLSEISRVATIRNTPDSPRKILVEGNFFSDKSTKNVQISEQTTIDFILFDDNARNSKNAILYNQYKLLKPGINLSVNGSFTRNATFPIKISWDNWDKNSRGLIYITDLIDAFITETNLPSSNGTYSYMLYQTDNASELYDYHDVTNIKITDLAHSTSATLTVSSTNNLFAKLVVKFNISDLNLATNSASVGYLISDIISLPKLPEKPKLIDVSFYHRGDYACNYKTNDATVFMNIDNCLGKARVARYYYDPGIIKLTWNTNEASLNNINNYDYRLMAKSNITNEPTIIYDLTSAIAKGDESIKIFNSTSKPEIKPGTLTFTISSTPTDLYNPISAIISTKATDFILDLGKKYEFWLDVKVKSSNLYPVVLSDATSKVSPAFAINSSRDQFLESKLIRPSSFDFTEIVNGNLDLTLEVNYPYEYIDNASNDGYIYQFALYNYPWYRGNSTIIATPVSGLAYTVGIKPWCSFLKDNLKDEYGLLKTLEKKICDSYEQTNTSLNIGSNSATTIIATTTYIAKLGTIIASPTVFSNTTTVNRGVVIANISIPLPKAKKYGNYWSHSVIPYVSNNASLHQLQYREKTIPIIFALKPTIEGTKIKITTPLPPVDGHCNIYDKQPVNTSKATLSIEEIYVSFTETAAKNCLVNLNNKTACEIPPIDPYPPVNLPLDINFKIPGPLPDKIENYIKIKNPQDSGQLDKNYYEIFIPQRQVLGFYVLSTGTNVALPATIPYHLVIKDSCLGNSASVGATILITGKGTATPPDLDPDGKVTKGATPTNREKMVLTLDKRSGNYPKLEWTLLDPTPTYGGTIVKYNLYRFNLNKFTNSSTFDHFPTAREFKLGIYTGTELEDCDYTKPIPSKFNKPTKINDYCSISVFEKTYNHGPANHKLSYEEKDQLREDNIWRYIATGYLDSMQDKNIASYSNIVDLIKLSKRKYIKWATTTVGPNLLTIEATSLVAQTGSSSLAAHPRDEYEYLVYQVEDSLKDPNDQESGCFSYNISKSGTSVISCLTSSGTIVFNADTTASATSTKGNIIFSDDFTTYPTPLFKLSFDLNNNTRLITDNLQFNGENALAISNPETSVNSLANYGFKFNLVLTESSYIMDYIAKHPNKNSIDFILLARLKDAGKADDYNDSHFTKKLQFKFRTVSSTNLISDDSLVLGMTNGCYYTENAFPSVNNPGLKTNRVYCFGTDQFGETGNGYNDLSINQYSIVARPVYISQATPLENIKKLDVGYKHSCAIVDPDNDQATLNNKIYCWGLNNSQSLVFGLDIGSGFVDGITNSATDFYNYAVEVNSSKYQGNPELISTGFVTTCVVTNSNQNPGIYCFGGNFGGSADGGGLINNPDSGKNILENGFTYSGSTVTAATTATFTSIRAIDSYFGPMFNSPPVATPKLDPGSKTCILGDIVYDGIKTSNIGACWGKEVSYNIAEDISLTGDAQTISGDMLISDKTELSIPLTTSIFERDRVNRLDSNSNLMPKVNGLSTERATGFFTIPGSFISVGDRFACSQLNFDNYVNYNIGTQQLKTKSDSISCFGANQSIYGFARKGSYLNYFYGTWGPQFILTLLDEGQRVDERLNDDDYDKRYINNLDLSTVSLIGPQIPTYYGDDANIINNDLIFDYPEAIAYKTSVDATSLFFTEDASTNRKTLDSGNGYIYSYIPSLSSYIEDIIDSNKNKPDSNISPPPGEVIQYNDIFRENFNKPKILSLSSGTDHSCARMRVVASTTTGATYEYVASCWGKAVGLNGVSVINLALDQQLMPIDKTIIATKLVDLRIPRLFSFKVIRYFKEIAEVDVRLSIVPFMLRKGTRFTTLPTNSASLTFAATYFNNVSAVATGDDMTCYVLANTLLSCLGKGFSHGFNTTIYISDGTARNFKNENKPSLINRLDF